MYMSSNLDRLLLAASVAALAGIATAGESQAQRQHDSHVHGIAQLNLAVEGSELHIEIESPAFNIVGFEHEPSSAADRERIDHAIRVLQDGERLFGMTQAAGCRLVAVDIDTPFGEVGAGTPSGSDHEHEHKAGHEHDAGHEKQEEHDHEAGPGHEHGDIDAAYRFDCERVDRLTGIDVGLFRAFPATERLDVQYVFDNRQGAATLTAADPNLRF